MRALHSMAISRTRRRYPTGADRAAALDRKRRGGFRAWSCYRRYKGIVREAGNAGQDYCVRPGVQSTASVWNAATSP